MLTFDKLSEQNAARAERWHAGGDEWTASSEAQGFPERL